MRELEAMALQFALVSVRLAPVLVVPALSPLSWAPLMVRMAVLLAFSLVLSLALWPVATDMPFPGLLMFALAVVGEALIGLTISLAVLLPNGALSFASRVVDMQSGFAAANLFNPSGNHEPEALVGSLMAITTTVLFFTLDLHLKLLGLLSTSLSLLPPGGAALGMISADALLMLVSAQFLLAFMIVSPIVLGLFAIDVGVAYLTRSMPQANVYFLALPFKIGMAMLLMAATLPYVPRLIERLFEHSIAALPRVLGA